MSIIAPNGLYVSASVQPAERNLSIKIEASHLAIAEAAGGQPSLDVRSAFVLVPRSEKQWERVRLASAGTTDVSWLFGRRSAQSDPVFVGSVRVDAAMLAKYGFAIGFETNAGPQWGQAFEANHFVSKP